MLDFMIHLIPTVIVLGVLIFVHELGHFLACRFAGVAVEKFSIGFGPELLSWRRGRTRYALSAIPFGGFVKPQGETSEEVKSRGGTLDPGDFLAASAWNRFVILAAGVTMNFLLAYVLFVLVMLVGRPVPAPVIGGFIEGLPAASSELKVGDEVTHVNGSAVSSWQDLTMKISSSGATPYLGSILKVTTQFFYDLAKKGWSEAIKQFRENTKTSKRKTRPMTLTVKREANTFDLSLNPKIDESHDIFGQPVEISHLGITAGNIFRIEKYSLQNAVFKAARLELEFTGLTFKALFLLATGRLSPKTIAGPIGIVSMTGKAAKMGLSALVQFIALLSVSLAVINLLPIPALDGGHIFFLAVEVLRRKPVSVKIQERITQFGFYFLMFLMVLVVFNDLSNMGVLDKIKSAFFPRAE